MKQNPAIRTIRTIRTIEEQQLDIAKRARLSRLFAGFTQANLASRSQVSYATLRKFEHTGEISLKSLLRIANALNEELPFANLFTKADFFEDLNPKLFKRPKLCKDGTYISSRKPSERELYECD
ncbi:MAG TPA: helix-turn-helix transcriptional regulator [Bacteroidales bacterium]|nr:helix-turn-helix transcriptional regulator [Bacteroidales bacterium]